MDQINENLYSFDELVRVELGPQPIELDATEENLENSVTAAHYQPGGRDALGRIIRPDLIGLDVDDPSTAIFEGEKMTVVDWDARFVPRLWKIYQMQGRRFVKIDEVADKDEALARAATIREEM